MVRNLLKSVVPKGKSQRLDVLTKRLKNVSSSIPGTEVSLIIGNQHRGVAFRKFINMAIVRQSAITRCNDYQYITNFSMFDLVNKKRVIQHKKYYYALLLSVEMH